MELLFGLLFFILMMTIVGIIKFYNKVFISNKYSKYHLDKDKEKKEK